MLNERMKQQQQQAEEIRRKATIQDIRPQEKSTFEEVISSPWRSR
jgi:hypothetical protein